DLLGRKGRKCVGKVWCRQSRVMIVTEESKRRSAGEREGKLVGEGGIILSLSLPYYVYEIQNWRKRSGVTDARNN
ncbi:hypothetical protein ACQ1ZA_16245, partial [Enterococcus faecalis]|uniref:hypothetical protein n=1 Tax=Enterococcus faecalis TaxID=1351 RepID=UPI003D6A9BCC